MDEGDTFYGYDVSFIPDTLRFQRTFVPNVADYETHVLAYDAGKKSVCSICVTAVTVSFYCLCLLPPPFPLPSSPLLPPLPSPTHPPSLSPPLLYYACVSVVGFN